MSKGHSPETTAFLLAVYHDQRDEARRILAKSPEIVHDSSDLGETVLHWLAVEGVRWAAKLVLENGASVAARDDSDEIALHSAAQLAHRSTVELLLAWGSDVGAPSKLSGTPLHEAARFADAAIIEILLSHGAEIEVRDNLDQTPLHEAVGLNNIETTRALLDAGASVESRDGFGETALLNLREDSVEFVELLVAHGSDLHARAIRGNTLLHTAAVFALPRVTRFLLERGLDPAATLEDGSTVLDELNRGATFGSRKDDDGARRAEVRRLLLWTDKLLEQEPEGP